MEDGQEFTLYKEKEQGDSEGVAISYPKLVDIFLRDGQDAIGRELLLDDGLISIITKEVRSDRIVCTVSKGGVLKNVAASFVRNHEDVRTLRDFIDSIGYEHVEIIAKIENQSGVDDMDLIMDYADGIMVARGDMGVEIPFIKLPEIQKTLIRKCVAKGKYVITATQMLESMTTAPRPTRAEISDVANAVYDGTSAVMLSGESAAGKYPLESVMALDSICREAEENGEFAALHTYVERYGIEDSNVFRGSICLAAKYIAEQVGAKAIIVESATGRVARAMVHYRPEVPVIAVVTSKLVCRRLCFNWGVTALMGEEKLTSDEITEQAMRCALSTGIVKKGDTVILLSSNKTLPTSGTDSLNIRIL